MMLIYTRESEGGPSPEEGARIKTAHRVVIEETARKGILLAAEPLSPTSTATTVRVQNHKPLITDGPFAETKEQLAGYYILDCENLDEAIEWAARIPTACKGSAGCIEIRPMPGLPRDD
ncbi:MAG: YciI family protein [Acidobacteriaceae bacterium]|nr:YciI family protein [Acidobacteriaceae bacterium]